jgi:hypothetical protein
MHSGCFVRLIPLNLTLIYYLVKNTGCEAPCYVIFSMPSCFLIIISKYSPRYFLAVVRRSMFVECKRLIKKKLNEAVTLCFKVKSKAVPLHAMQALGGEEVYSSYSFTASALDGGEWSASRPGRALPPGKGPPVPI